MDIVGLARPVTTPTLASLSYVGTVAQWQSQLGMALQGGTSSVCLARKAQLSWSCPLFRPEVPGQSPAQQLISDHRPECKQAGWQGLNHSPLAKHYGCWILQCEAWSWPYLPSPWYRGDRGTGPLSLPASQLPGQNLWVSVRGSWQEEIQGLAVKFIFVLSLGHPCYLSSPKITCWFIFQYNFICNLQGKKKA